MHDRVSDLDHGVQRIVELLRPFAGSRKMMVLEELHQLFEVEVLNGVRAEVAGRTMLSVIDACGNCGHVRSCHEDDECWADITPVGEGSYEQCP